MLLSGSVPNTPLALRAATGKTFWTNSSGCVGGGGGTPVVANPLLYAPIVLVVPNGTRVTAYTLSTNP